MPMGKNRFLAAATVHVESARSARVCVGFPRGLWFPPASHRWARDVNRGVWIVPVWMSVSVTTTGRESMRDLVLSRLNFVFILNTE